MAAKAEFERHAPLLAKVEGDPYVVERIELEHEMMKPLGHLRLPECQRVMARIAVQKGNIETRFNVALGLGLHPVTEPHAQHVAVKLEAPLHVFDAHGDVPEAHRRGDEAVDWTRRFKRNINSGQRSVECFRGDSAWIPELYDFHDSARFSLRRRASMHFDSSCR